VTGRRAKRTRSPRLTFFVELPGPELGALFADGRVADFLARGGFDLSMGILDLAPERAWIVRELEGRGVGVTAWLLLDESEGYWLNADNAAAARARWHEARDFAAREGLRFHRVGLDIEPPRAEFHAALRRGARGLLDLVLARRTPEQVARAEAAYAVLVDEIHGTGRSVETYQIPFLLDERRAASTLVRRSLGLVDVKADLDVPMLYSSYLGRSLAVSYMPEAAAIALGVTGGGVVAAEDAAKGRTLGWPELERELRWAAGHADELYVFSLEGCVEQGMLDALSTLDWSRAAPPEPAAQRPPLLRRALGLALRAEPWLDRLLPQREREDRPRAGMS
jgi:hypothetical protein